jgi:exodeoxyribonuclease VII small subunit
MNPQNFEHHLEKLEKIGEQIGDPETTLAEAVSLYKEALRSVALCGEQLKGFESEVLLLRKQSEDTFALLNFDEVTNV